MPQKYRHCLLLTAFLLPGSALYSLTATAEAVRSEAEIRQDLNNINQQIQSLNEKSLKREGKIGALKLKLKQLDQEISNNSSSLQRLQSRAKELEQTRTNVRRTLSTQRSGMNQQSELLSQQLRSYHREWRIAANRALFQIAPLDQQLRQQVYFTHLHRARLDRIRQLTSSSQQTSSTDSKLSGELKELQTLQAQALEKQKELEENKKNRRSTLRQLANLSKKDTLQLSTLKQSRKELNSLIDKLRALASQPTAMRMGKVPFEMLKGKLKWPIKGKVSKGSAPGVTISATAGQPVRAIGYGRVVFSDWMRGFGMLVIIDHGDGYMSLYGQNESLLKQQGEMVEPGTTISTSGHNTGTGIYFEIRKNADPQDPRKWCTS